jgi:hypothetical protein
MARLFCTCHRELSRSDSQDIFLGKNGMIYSQLLFWFLGRSLGLGLIFRGLPYHQEGRLT